MIVLWKGSDQIFLFFFGPLFSFLAGVLVTWAEHVTISHFVIKIFLKKTTFVSSKFNAAFAQKQRVYCELWQYTSGQRLKVRWHVNFPAYFIQSCQNCWAATSLSNVLCACFCSNILHFFIDPDLFQIISSKWTDCFSNVQATATRRVVFITVLFVYKAHLCVVYS